MRQNRMLTGPEAFELGFADRLLEPVEFVDESIAFALELVAEQSSSHEPDSHGCAGSDAEGAREGSTTRCTAPRPRRTGARPDRGRAHGLVARGGLPRRGGGRRRAAARAGRRRPRSTRSTSSSGARRARRAGPDAEPRPMRKVGIVGAGLMATQLATLFLRRLEVPVVMRDLERGGARRARAAIEEELAEQVAKGRYDEGKARFLASLVSTSTGYDELRRLRPRARGGLRGARGQAAGLRRAARARRGPTACSRRTRRASRSRRWAPTSACTSSTRSPCCRSSSSSARRAPTTRRSPPRGRSPRSCASGRARRATRPAFVVNRVLTRLMTRRARRARARQHRRGDRRGDPARSACRWRRRCCCRWSARASRTTCSRRCTRPTPTASRSRRRSRTTPRASDEIVVREQAPRTRDEILEAALEALADEIRHLLDEGVVAEAADVDTALLLGAGWPVLPRRDHQVPRPGRAFRRRCSGARSPRPARGRPQHERRLAHPDPAATRPSTARRCSSASGSTSAPTRPSGSPRSSQGHRLAVSRDDDDDLRLRGVASRRPSRLAAIVQAELARRGHRRPSVDRSSTGSPTRSAGSTSRRRRPGSRRSSSTATRRGRCGSSCRRTARRDELADQLESEGYDVVRRWRYLIVGAASRGGRERARAARPRRGRAGRRSSSGRSRPQNPFAVFGGLGGSDAARAAPADRLCFGERRSPRGLHASALSH